MDKNTGKSGQATTVGDLFDKTIDKMFQDKNFLNNLGKQETPSFLSSSQRQVSGINSTFINAKYFFRVLGTPVLMTKRTAKKKQSQNIFGFERRRLADASAT